MQMLMKEPVQAILVKLSRLHQQTVLKPLPMCKSLPKRVSVLQRKCIKRVLAIPLEHPMILTTS